MKYLKVLVIIIALFLCNWVVYSQDVNPVSLTALDALEIAERNPMK